MTSQVYTAVDHSATEPQYQAPAGLTAAAGQQQLYSSEAFGGFGGGGDAYGEVAAPELVGSQAVGTVVERSGEENVFSGFDGVDL